MKDARYFLIARFWVAPDAEAQVMGWLDGGHVAEVTGQPGFLWSRRIRLEKDAQGWQGYCMIYGIEDRAAFERYSGNHALHAKFAKEREPFAHQMKIDRFSGEVVADAP
jgi:hypothetical protein